MMAERTSSRISSKRKAELRDNPDAVELGNDGNKTNDSEKSVNLQTPWVILLERMSENGHRTSETTDGASLDSTLIDFLKLETVNLDARAEEIKVSIQEASGRTSHGKKRAGRVIRDERESHNKELTKILEYKEILLGNLSGKRRDPIKINIEYNGEVSGWEFPKGSETLWVQYVRNENPGVLALPPDEKAIVQKAFMLRHAVGLDVPDAKQEYYELMAEVKGRSNLEDYLVEFTERFTG